jgi:hypothetical protein
MTHDLVILTASPEASWPWTATDRQLGGQDAQERWA